MKKRINESFIIHKRRLVIVDQITDVFPFVEFAVVNFFVDFHSNICGCQSSIMLHPLIMNGWGFYCVAMLEPLLLTQVLADTGNECQPKL